MSDAFRLREKLSAEEIQMATASLSGLTEGMSILEKKAFLKGLAVCTSTIGLAAADSPCDVNFQAVLGMLSAMTVVLAAMIEDNEGGDRHE